MLQTFKDHYSDVVEFEENAAMRFWCGVVNDEARGILREQFIALKESTYMKNAWIKQGILFGVLLGIFHIAYDLINNLGPANTTLNSLLNTSILPAVLIFCSIAGYAAARKTGQMKTGTYAGLFTGLLSIVIGMSALFVITFVFMGIIRENAFLLDDFQRSGLKSIDQFIIEDAMGAALVGTLISLLAGGIFGTLGGFLGRTVRERR
jgi:Na+/H+-dicarboxylate symporter